MDFLFGTSLSPERFEELNKRVSQREELIYQIRVGNSVRALQIFGEDTGASFKEVKAAVRILEKEIVLATSLRLICGIFARIMTLPLFA